MYTFLLFCLVFFVFLTKPLAATHKKMISSLIQQLMER